MTPTGSNITTALRVLCRVLIILVLGQVSAEGLYAQDLGPTTARTDSTSPVIIDFAEQGEYIFEDTVTIQRLTGDVGLRQDSTFIYGEEVEIVNETFVRARGNVVIRQNDTISVFADSLRYNAETELADLYGNVVLVNGEQKLFTDSLFYDLGKKLARYDSRAKITDGAAQLSSLRGVYDVNAALATFKDSVFVVRPDFNLLADTLSFGTDSRIVYFEGPTLMATPDSKVYTEDGFYRLADTFGVFTKMAQVQRGDQLIQADSIIYAGATDEFTLIGNARFKDSTQSAEADRIVYREATNKTVLTGSARFQRGEQVVAGDRLDYDGDSGQFRSSGRVRLSEPPYLLAADSLWYDEAGGVAHVVGNVFLQDTLDKRTIQARQVDFRNDDQYVLAFGDRPLMSMIVEEDTLYLSADTLLSYQQAYSALQGSDSLLSNTLDSSEVGTLSTDSTNFAVEPAVPVLDESVVVSIDSLQAPDSVRYILAYNDVRIFKNDIQAISDSLAFNTLDSTLTLYRSPYLWSDTSQFSADTISIALLNKSIDRVHLQTNSLVVNSTDEHFFNQVQGRNMDVQFDSSRVNRMDVRGNAESVYYIQDDTGAYTGMNYVQSARIKLLFDAGELTDIYFYQEPDGSLSPMKPIGETTKKLARFTWQTDSRPRSVEDLRTPVQ